jgi:hypothetical protein
MKDMTAAAIPIKMHMGWSIMIPIPITPTPAPAYVEGSFNRPLNHSIIFLPNKIAVLVLGS